MQTGYLLPGNQKQQTLKRFIKFTAIIFILIMLMSSLSGCVELKHGKSAEENPILWWDESSEQYKTQLHPDNPNDSSTMPRPEGLKRKVDITPSHPILLKFGDRVHTGLLREVCIIMHNSIFSEDLRYAYENDHLVDANNIKVLSLEPAGLIVKVSEITAQFLDPSTNANMRPIIDSMKGIAAAILISMWAMGFISQIVNEKFTMETLLKTLMQLLCGILIVTNATTIVTAFMNAGIELVDTLGSNAPSTFTNLHQDIVKRLESVSISDAVLQIGPIHVVLSDPSITDTSPFVGILYMILPFVAQLLLAYKICSIMIMRMLELVIRITFAPIPIAFSAQSGFSQEATRYLRATLACAVQPALMLVGCAFVEQIGEVILQIFNTTGGTGGPSGPLGSVAMCMSYFILSAFIGETKHMAQEVIAR